MSELHVFFAQSQLPEEGVMIILDRESRKIYQATAMFPGSREPRFEGEHYRGSIDSGNVVYLVSRGEIVQENMNLLDSAERNRVMALLENSNFSRPQPGQVLALS